MSFNQLISEKLHPLFTEHGLEVTEHMTNIVSYQSTKLYVSLVHNPRENSNTLWVGKSHSDTVEIDNHLMRDYYDSDLKLSNLSQDDFVKNVFLFFLGDGEKLLTGNESDLISLGKFSEKRSEEYTENLLEKQSLDAANRAWKEGNYLDVIKHLKSVNEENLPASYKQKYKIAQKRLSN